MRKYFKKITEELKSTRHLWKISISNRVIGKDMYCKSIHKSNILSSNTHGIIAEIFEFPIRKIDEIDDQMEWSGFVGILNFRCKKVKFQEDHHLSGHKKDIKNATINPQNNDGKCFHYALVLTKHNEEFKKHRKRLRIIKPFIIHYIWNGTD